MYREYSGWSTRPPSGVSSWTNSAPPMISGTGATNAATATASTAAGGVATSLSLTGTPSSRTRDHRQLASGHERAAGSPPSNALMAGTQCARVAARTFLASTRYLQKAHEVRIGVLPGGARGSQHATWPRSERSRHQEVAGDVEQ